MLVKVWVFVENFLGSEWEMIVSHRFMERETEILRVGEWSLTVLSAYSPD